MPQTIIDRPEADAREAALPRMASIVFDERPAAVRCGLQVVMALMIGVLIGNSLNIMI
jgi:hypothetical protein